MSTSEKIEKIDGKNWREFVAAPVAVLMLGKSDCEACSAWTSELEQFLASDVEWKDVRFGKVLLDKGGLIELKRENPWIADVHDLPFNTIWKKGERAKSWAGGGVERLVGRLRNLSS